MSAAYAETDIGTYTSDLASVFRSACARAGIDLDVDCAPVVAFVDHAMWEIIVSNLLSNAFKFTFTGSITVSVGPSESGGAVLTVKDTGVGIPVHEQDRIFDRFHRAATTKGRSFEGSGIGLALVRELVTLHGGTISLVSSDGEGTTVIVEVPTGADHLDPASIVSPADAATPTNADSYAAEALQWIESDADSPVPAKRARPLVVVADDNADMRRYLHRTLSAAFDVVTVPNGVAALAAVREQRPDTLVSDVMMPVMDGLALTRAVRDDEDVSATPVLLLSARAGTEATLDGLEHGADDYLVKPFKADELAARLRALIDVSRRGGTGATDAAALEMRARLSSSLNAATSAQAIIDTVGTVLAGLPSFNGALLAVLHEDGRFADQHWDGSRNRQVQATYFRIPVDLDLPQTCAIRELRTVLIGDIADPTRLADVIDDSHAAGTRACAATPLSGDAGNVLGALMLTWRDPRDFDAADVSFVEEVAGHVAKALARVRAVEHERTVASTLQRSLLRLDLPSQDVVVGARYLSADAALQVGGDWYDVIARRDRRVVAAVGDVVGRGLPAAVTMSRLRASLGITAMQIDGPAGVVEHLDAYAEQIPGARCTTVAVAYWDTASGTVSYVAAGHPPPLAVLPDGTVRVLDGGRSWPLHVAMRRPRPPAAQVSLPVGSTIVMYTDGLIERRGELLDDGLSRLAHTLERSWMLPTANLVAEIVRDMAVDTPGMHDDVAILAVRTCCATTRVFADVIDSQPAAISDARMRFRAWLAGASIAEDTAEALVLATGEAVANAVQHGNRLERGRYVTVEACAGDDELVVSIADGGSWRPAGPTRQSRGYTLMESLVDDVSVLRDERGTTVTLRMARQQVSA